ncbi:bile acid:sodium symporter family protein [Poseidonocella sedimentorum]|uniref:Bile acid:Na+ symporter, BASS family n=1 Tax=Poseidonocella sedimentorum TaxID=871652 RepID=A0A1I6EPI0_9RHOB|nr:bile acid:sodium symporter family protein [Poseidonocella sedimentorum]SFR19693.1 bile acid:Na+ symporter, BASS family [Poseidonocella sedimentorum]
MDILVNIVLPLSLAVIMLSLGIGLTPADFRRVAERGWVFAIGAICQLFLLPVVAYVIVLAFGLSGAIAAGIMLLAFCPGGVTSNVVTRLARGDVALSVSLTALISLLSIVTVPFLVGWSVVHFMGEDAPAVSVVSLAIAMFLLTALPVSVGMAIRHIAPGFANRIEPRLVALASLLFVLIILAAIVSNWDLLLSNIASLGPALALLNIVTMLAGLLIGAATGMSWPEQKTISIEVGIQNGTLGITLAPLIAGVAGGIPTIGLPSALYGVIMYVTAIPFVLWLRSR